MENNLKKYFLETLSKAEIEAIDLRLLKDAEFEEELLLAKNNLMEDYLDGSLAPGEVESFQRNFLKPEERKKELKNLALVRNYASRKQAESAAGKPKETSAGFFDRLNKFFAINWRPLALGSAAVILIAVFAGVYFFNSGGELAQLNQKDFSNVEDYRNLTNLNLISGAFRSSNPSVKLSADKLTDPVFLRLGLPLEGEIFDVNVTRNEEKMAENLRLRSYPNQNGRELRMLLPASGLTKGSYKIEVFAADSKSAPVVYTFTVQ